MQFFLSQREKGLIIMKSWIVSELNVSRETDSKRTNFFFSREKLNPADWNIEFNDLVKDGRVIPLPGLANNPLPTK